MHHGRSPRLADWRSVMVLAVRTGDAARRAARDQGTGALTVAGFTLAVAGVGMVGDGAHRPRRQVGVSSKPRTATS